MAYNVKFAKGSQLAYDGLASTGYDAGTLYFVTDANAQAFYLGDQKLSSVAEVASLIIQANTNTADITKIKAALSGIDYTKEENADTVMSVLNAAIAGVNDTIGDLDDLTTTAKGDIVSSINEVKDAVDNTATDSVVTVTEAVGSGSVLKTYTIRQGTAEVGNPDSNIVGTINIPKDLVVTSGRLVEISVDENDSTKFVDANNVELPYATAAGTFIELTVANQTEPLYIDVHGLIDIYTPAPNATQVQLAVVNNVISASIVAASITSTELADDSVITSKIADNNVTKAKLSTTLQTSIDYADSSVQTVAEGDNDYTVKVTQADGTATNVAVHGLKSAALEEASAFDVNGAAASVLGVSTDGASDTTVYGAHAHADAAESNAKTYTDTALTWGAIGGGSSSGGGDTPAGGGE